MTASEPVAQPLPSTREELLALHREARQRRVNAEPGGHEWAAASAEVSHIEVRIAQVEREMTPPRM